MLTRTKNLELVPAESSSLDEANVLRQELGSLIIELRAYAKGLRDIGYKQVDPELIAEQIEDIIGGE